MLNKFVKFTYNLLFYVKCGIIYSTVKYFVEACTMKTEKSKLRHNWSIAEVASAASYYAYSPKGVTLKVTHVFSGIPASTLSRWFTRTEFRECYPELTSAIISKKHVNRKTCGRKPKGYTRISYPACLPPFGVNGVA